MTEPKLIVWKFTEQSSAPVQFSPEIEAGAAGQSTIKR
jgi:hypothetical protein